MPLKKNEQMVIPLLALDEASPSTVTQLLEHVPKYGPREWRRLVENTVGAIHQIPKILAKRSIPNLDLKDIEAYFGRSSAGADIKGRNVYDRFRAGKRDRKHQFAMVFARTTIRGSLNFERFGISLIDQLRESDGLCISNRTLCSRGNVGNTEPGYLYMTFCLKKGKEHARVLSQPEIEMGIRSVLEDLSDKIDGGVKSVHEEAAGAGFRLANDVTCVGEHRIALASRD